MSLSESAACVLVVPARQRGAAPGEPALAGRWGCCSHASLDWCCSNGSVGWVLPQREWCRSLLQEALLGGGCAPRARLPRASAAVPAVPVNALDATAVPDQHTVPNPSPCRHQADVAPPGRLPGGAGLRPAALRCLIVLFTCGSLRVVHAQPLRLCATATAAPAAGLGPCMFSCQLPTNQRVCPPAWDLILLLFA